MRVRHFLATVLLAGLVALPALATEYTVKVSLSRKDPNVSVGENAGTDPVEFYVFVDGHPTKGGEFGLSLDGGECIGFEPDPDLPWITLPLVRPYPGTISQATAGDKCADPPVCFGKLLVKPDEAGGRIVVDLIPSTRAKDAAILDCNLKATNWFVAYPAVVNKGSQEPPVPHVVQRPGDPPQMIPDEEAPAPTAVTPAPAPEPTAASAPDSTAASAPPTKAK
ncbi:MAG: hypothetical protein U0167_15345 [bacterium]